jgi:1-acyl-sn-glycerol-3-phosphate acyltransferase
MKPWFYAFAKFIARLIVTIIFPVRMAGAHNLPASGAAILCGNHVSLLDPLAAGAAAGRHIRFMAKKELFEIPVLRGCIRALGAFPVDRGNADMAAMRAALATLKQGHVLGIFPQGRRVAGGEGGMESGVALIALRSGAPVIPMRIAGRYRFWRRNTLIIGAPVQLPKTDGRMDSAALKQATQAIEAAIAALK